MAGNELFDNVNALTWGSWNETPAGENLGQPITLTFRFLDPGALPAYYATGNPVLAPLNAKVGAGFQTRMQAFNADQQFAAELAFDAWAKVANVYRSGSATDGSRTVTFGLTQFNSGGAAAEAFTPVPTRASNIQSNPIIGDVWLNLRSKYVSQQGYGQGSENFLTLLHEIGHALGLKHPVNQDKDGGDEGPYFSGMKWNSTRYTVMSYNRLLGNDGAQAFTPMLLDIAALQRLYGANPNTNAGSDTYHFTTILGWPIQAIWDAGGTDTIDGSDQTQKLHIDLNPGGESYVDNLFSRGEEIHIAFTPMGPDNQPDPLYAFNYIENAIGGAGDDTMLGNDGDNKLEGREGKDKITAGFGGDTLEGGQGDDTLDGGVGDDIYVYTAGDGKDTITDIDGGALRIGGLDLVGNATRTTNSDPKYRNKLAWTLDFDGAPLTLTLIDGKLQSGGTLLITGAALGADGSIAIKKFFNDERFGFLLAPENSVKTVDGAPTLNENHADTITIKLAGIAQAGEKLHLTPSDLGQYLKVVTGADTLAFGGDGLDISLEEGQSQVIISLLSDGDVDEDTSITLTASVKDAQGNTHGAPVGLNIAFDAIDEDAPAAVYTRYGDLAPVIDDHRYQWSQPPGFGGSIFPPHWFGNLVTAGEEANRSDRLIAANLGDSALYGLGGNDVLIGLDGNDLLDGGDGADYLASGTGADTIYGGAGDDLIASGAAIIPYVPATDDVPTYQASGAYPVVGQGWNWAMVRLPNGDLGLEMDTYVSAAGSSELTMDLGDTVDAGAGDDYVDTGYGDDTLEGGLGNDRMTGAPGNDHISGGEGDDFLRGDAFITGSVGGTYYPSTSHGKDFIDGGAGNDTIRGDGGDDVLLGGVGNDLILGDDNEEAATPAAIHGADFIDGGEGNDNLWGGGGADIIYGGIGNDAMVGDSDDEHAGDDYLNGEDGNDTAFGSAGDDTLVGGAGDDVMDGDSDVTAGEFHGEDYLDGGVGNDSLIGNGGADVLVGGDGDDLLFGDSTYVAGEFQGNDQLDGGAGADVMWGEGGADILLGGDGDDQLSGDDSVVDAQYQGDDQLDGGLGNDHLWGDGGADTLSGGEGNDYLEGDSSTTPAQAHGNDYLDGGDGDDLLLGDGGNDTLIGGAGHDQLQGGAGDDLLIGGTGDDDLFGEAGDDTFILEAGAGVVYLEDEDGANHLVVNDAQDLQLGMNNNGHVVLTLSESDAIVMTRETLENLDISIFGQTLHGSFEELVAQFYKPPVLAPQSDYISLGAGVSAGQVGMIARNQDLILTYSGSVQDWIDLDSLWARHVLVSEGNAAAYGLPSGTRVLVIHNWYDSDGGFLSRIIDDFGNQVDFSLQAMTLPHSFVGSAGDDVIQGGFTADTLNGAAGSDQIYAQEGDDSLTGGTGDDFLFGGAGNDTYNFNLGDGKDLIIEETGTNDVLRFGPGITPENLTVTETVDGLVVRVGPAINGDQLTILDWALGGSQSIEHFVFDNGVSLNRAAIDALNVANHSPRVAMQIQNRLVAANQFFSFQVPLNAFSDADAGDTLTYSASAANNEPLPSWLNFDAATRTLSGTPPTGVDAEIPITVIVSDGQLAMSQVFSLVQATIYTGTAGNDSITGGASFDRIDGLEGNDVLRGGAGDDTIDGGDGSDVLFGGILEDDGSGNDTLEGGAGTDIIYGADGNDVITDISGDDQIYAGSGDDIITGGPGYDLIEAGAGNDLILYSRGDGTDELRGNDETPGTVDILRFGAGILPSQIRVESDWLPQFSGAGFRLRLLDSSGAPTTDALWFRYYFDSIDSKQGLPNRIEFESDPLTVWTQADLEQFLFVPTNANNYILGTSAVDSIDALQGDDYLSGFDGNDVLSGSGGTDEIHGGNGNDTLDGGAGYDRLYGEAGDDVLRAGDDGGSLIGGEGNDTLYSGSGSSEVIGGNGDDVFYAGASQGVYYGDHGSDLFVVERASGPVYQTIYRSTDYYTFVQGPTEVDTLRMGAGILPGDLRVWQSDEHNTQIDIADAAGLINRTNSIGIGSSGGLTIDRLEFQDAPGVVLTKADLQALSLIGNAADNALFGYEGADAILGNAGNDVLMGHQGDDDLSGGTGNDQLYGNEGDDTLRFGAGQGSDEIFDLTGSNRIVLDSGITPSRVTLYRTSGNGHLGYYWENSPTNADSLVLVIDAGTDQLMLESFFDTASPNAFSQLVFGDGTIWDNATIRSHVVDLSGTANSATGTGGNDSFTVNHRGDTVADSSSTDVDTVTSTVSFTLPGNVENLILSGPFNLVGSGNSGNNSITGNAGANELDGQGGTDTLIGGLGDDTYQVAVLNPLGTTIVELAGEGYDTLVTHGNSSYTLPANVERLLSGGVGASNVTLAGNELDNVIDARPSYSDSLTIDGGLGADVMYGNEYDNRFIVDNPGDVVIDELGISLDYSNRDVVATSISYTLGYLIEDIELTGSAAITATGNVRGNTLNGATNSAANLLIGGLGDDEYILGAGDVAVENPNEGSDSIVYTGPAGNPQNSFEVGAYANIEGIRVTDAAGAATLLGDAGGNKLSGNSYDNVLQGEAGDDQLIGGAGDDRYLAFSSTSGADVITDTGGEDTIEIAPGIAIDQLQFSRVADDLRITLGGAASITVSSWYDEDLDNTVEQLLIEDQGLLYSYRADQLENAVSGVNSAPIVNAALQEVDAMATVALSYQLPANVFSDLESQHSLSWSVTQANGAALPTWLSFNATTRTLSGTAQATEIGTVGLKVVVTDAGGLSATNAFDLVVGPWVDVGTSGDDIMNGDASDNVIDGLAGNDTINGLGGNDVLYGSEGNDSLDGGTGQDEMYGGSGDDVYYVDDIDDLVVEEPGEGIDEVRSSITLSLASDVENLTLIGTDTIGGTGNSRDNLITGNSAANSLSGGSGNDTLDGGAGADSMSGGSGDDDYYVDTGDTLSESFNQGYDTVYSAITWTLGNFFEDLVLLGTGNINGTGSFSANVIVGNSGNNTLNGGGGADELSGGLGNDIYVVDNIDDEISEYSGEGTDTVQALINFTLPDEVENLQLLVAAAVEGHGNALDNVLTGNSANNILDGGAGNDTLNGSSGTDTMSGGLGNDTYTVDNIGDIVTENPGEGIDLVQSSVTFTIGDNIENLTLTGFTAINGTGNALDNVLTGNSMANTLTGGGGNDTLDGGSGTDTMIGGAGDDIYFANTASDIITEAANEGIDLVNAAATFSISAAAYANVELLFLTGTANNNATGNTLANLLRGTSGNNTLTGSGGTDILEGGGGTDSLTNSSGNTLLNGGAGTDTLTGMANNDLLIGGAGNDALNTGNGADIIAFNLGDGQDTVAVSTTKDNVISIGGGAKYSDLKFQKTGNNLLLKVGATDQITFTNYYSVAANRSVNKLQVVIEGTTDYVPGSSDVTRDNKVETFDFGNLVAAFDAAGAPNSWALSNALLANYLSGSDTAAIGGDLAYRYNRFGNLSDISFTPAIGILSNASFGTSTQALQTLASLQDTTPRLS